MCFVNSTWSAKKAPIQKCAKNAKNYQTMKNFSSLVSLTRHFTKFIFLEQLTAMPKFNMQIMLLLFFFFFFFFFRSSHHDTNPLLHLYHFRKKKKKLYTANFNSESSKVIFFFFVFFFFFFFFVSIQWVKHFCTPANFVTIWSTVLNNKNKLYATYVLVCQNCTLIFSRTRKRNWIIICQCCLRIWRAGRGLGG